MSTEEDRFAIAQKALGRGIRLADHLGLSYDDRLQAASTAVSMRALLQLLTRDDAVDFAEFVDTYAQIVAEITTELRGQYEDSHQREEERG